MPHTTKFTLIGLALVLGIAGCVGCTQKSVVQQLNGSGSVEIESGTTTSRIFHSSIQDFEIEYPPSYSIKSEGVFVSKELEFSIKGESNQNNIPVARWINEHPNYVEGSEEDVDPVTGFVVAGASELTPVSVAGLDGLGQRYGAEGGYLQWRVFLSYNKQIYIITFSGYPADGVDRAELDYKYFLNHFKLK